jgi:hypothetical protein
MLRFHALTAFPLTVNIKSPAQHKLMNQISTKEVSPMEPNISNISKGQIQIKNTNIKFYGGFTHDTKYNYT